MTVPRRRAEALWISDMMRALMLPMVAVAAAAAAAALRVQWMVGALMLLKIGEPIPMAASLLERKKKQFEA